MALVEMLNAWGCYVIQGYVYYRPLTPEAMVQELTRTMELRGLPTLRDQTAVPAG